MHFLTTRYSKRNSIGPESPVSDFGEEDKKSGTEYNASKMPTETQGKNRITQYEDHPTTKFDENSSEIEDGI